MRLYVGEVRTDEYNDISEYKVCRTFKDAIDWCIENTPVYKEGPKGSRCEFDAYDRKVVDDRVFFYDKEVCCEYFYYEGYFAIRTIDV